MTKSKFVQGEITKTGRKRSTQEIWTPPEIVKEMLDLLQSENVKENVFRPDSTFLEPTCGDGNFVVEIYRRKLNNCTCRKDAETALASVWAIELQPDNMEVCKERVRALFAKYGYGDLDFESVFKTNFIVDDALKVMKKWSLENEIDNFSLK
jgi:hypothetical protein